MKFEVPETLSSMLEDRKILYIFKTVDSEDSSKEISVDDNIYKKVKSLTKSVEDLRSQIDDNKKTLEAFQSKSKNHFEDQKKFMDFLMQRLRKDKKI